MTLHRRQDPPVTPVAVYSGTTANEIWLAALEAFGKGGIAVRQSSRDGDTLEVLHALLCVTDPRQRWIVARQPAINPAFAIAEALWMLWGRNDEVIPGFFSNRYRHFNGPGPHYKGAYGYRLRKSFGFDQLARASDALGAANDSRQVVLQIWNALEDMPHQDGSPRRQDVPCNVVSMLKLRNGRLHWTQVLRSNDLILGVPYNIVQFTIIQEVLAGWLGVEVGPYTHLSDSLHMYERDFASSHSPSSLDVKRNDDDLSLGRLESGKVLAALERAVEELVKPDLDRQGLQRAARLDTHRSYQNLLAILAAESARRRRWHDLSDQLVEGCTNPVLQDLWVAWASRFPRTSAAAAASRFE